jgi:hypothetical protein
VYNYFWYKFLYCFQLKSGRAEVRILAGLSQIVFNIRLLFVLPKNAEQKELFLHMKKGNLPPFAKAGWPGMVPSQPVFLWHFIRHFCERCWTNGFPSDISRHIYGLPLFRLLPGLRQ